MKFKSIRTPLLLILLGISILPLGLTWLFVNARIAEIAALAREESLKLAYADLDHILVGVVDLVSLRDEYVAHGQAADTGRVAEAIKAIRVGKTGYVYVLDARGSYLISQGGKRDGESIWGAQDADGRFFIQEIIRKALALGPGEIAEERYPWLNQGDSAPRMKVARIAYVPSSAWIIGVGSYLDEFMAAPAAIESVGRRSLQTIALLVGLVLLCTIVIAVVFASYFSAQIIVSGQAMMRLSQGELAQDIAELEVKRRDEIGDLLSSMKEMVLRLIAAVSGVRESAAQLSKGSSQLSMTAQSLSEGSTRQAAASEEVSSSMEELAAAVKESASSAEETSLIAARNAREAEEGKKAVGEAVEAMREISRKIGVIEEIARQTNYLSLNAAIEAARAGQEGAGFAIVAKEIRKLAEISREAATEIVGLSESSMRLSDRVAGNFDSLLPGIQKTASLVDEISASSKEQSLGIDQVDTALVQLDTIIQRNASSSEQLAAMAEELAAEAKAMIDKNFLFPHRGLRKARHSPPPPRGRRREAQGAIRT